MSDESLFDEAGNPRLSPRDGYRATTVRYPPGQVSLWIEFRVGGELVRSVELYSWKKPTLVEDGLICRLGILLESVCRFLNTGGSLESQEPGHIPHLIGRLTAYGIHGIELPDGYALADSTQNTDGQWEHLFIDPQDAAIRWVEDVFVDPLTKEQLTAELKALYQDKERQSGRSTQIHDRADSDDAADPGRLDEALIHEEEDADGP